MASPTEVCRCFLLQHCSTCSLGEPLIEGVIQVIELLDLLVGNVAINELLGLGARPNLQQLAEGSNILAIYRPANNLSARIYSLGGTYTASMPEVRHKLPSSAVPASRRKPPTRSLSQVFGSLCWRAASRSAAWKVSKSGELLEGTTSLISTSTSLVEGQFPIRVSINAPPTSRRRMGFGHPGSATPD